MARLVCLLPSFSEDTYFRDMFLFPYYIGKLNNMPVTIAFHGKKEQKESKYRGVNLLPLHYKGTYDWFSFKGEWYLIWYAFKNAKKMDVLVRFHFSYQTALIGLLYKLRNPKGFFYIKGDGYGLWLSLFRTNPWFKKDGLRNQKNILVKIKNSIIHAILVVMCKCADKVSVELPEIYDYLKKDKYFILHPEKLKLVFNGIDEEELASFNIKERTIAEKENLIISVGRHGNWQKNTEMFLSALSKLDLKDWKVLFIGSIESIDCPFQKEIDQFFNTYPELMDNVKFIGPIYDQKLLYEYYNKAKVFVHTAVYESYGIVLGEAFRFNNYIISTDVGIASELIKYGYGKLCRQGSVEELVTCLQQVIDGAVDLEYLNLLLKNNNRLLSYNSEILKLGGFKK